MTSGLIVFLELALVLGFALVFGIREMRNMRRYDRDRAAREAGKKDAEGDRGGDPVA
jgi:hypothetical protein